MRKTGLVLSLLLFICFPVRNTFAQEKCNDIDLCNANDLGYQQCLEDIKDCLEANLSETRKKKTTLESTISIINGNISIQQVKINQTKNEIAVLEREITDLDSRISGLSLSLDRLSSLLVERIRTQYKREQINPLSFVATSKSLGEFLSQFRYLRIAGKQTAQAMQKADYQKTVYDEQKELKEQKQTEVEAKRYELQLEQNELVNQRATEQNLLSITQNDEQRFQELIKEAQEQIDSIRRYTANKDTSLLSNMTQCDSWGCYYNQRDAEWGNQLIGDTSDPYDTMANVGCLVTAVAMITSHYGKTLTPAQIAASSNPFASGTAGMLWTWLGSVNGVTANRTRVGYNASALDAELSAGKPVIVRITAANSVGTHFVVITEKVDGKYMMKDPYESDGNNIPFTDKHSLSQITAVDRVTVY